MQHNPELCRSDCCLSPSLFQSTIHDNLLTSMRTVINGMHKLSIGLASKGNEVRRLCMVVVSVCATLVLPFPEPLPSSVSSYCFSHCPLLPFLLLLLNSPALQWRLLHPFTRCLHAIYTIGVNRMFVCVVWVCVV